MSVAGELLERVLPRRMPLEVFEGTAHADRQEGLVPVTGHEDEAGVGLWRLGGEILVAPQGGVSVPVHEAGVFAHRVVAFVMRGLDVPVEDLGQQPRRVQTPLRIYPADLLAVQKGNGERQFQSRL